MLGFLKKIFGLPTEEEVKAAEAVEPPMVNNKTGDIVDKVEAPKEVVNSQITDAVTQTAPAKKVRKSRTPKVEKVVKEKAAKPVKVAAKKVVSKRSNKV